MTASATSRDRGGRWGRLIGVGLLSAGLSAGCLSPQERHRVLSFLLDGVPPLDAAEAPVPPEETRPEERAVVQISHRPETILVRHPPACDDCHAERSAAFKLSQPKETLCWECHDPDDFVGAVVHGPVGAGQCVACHSPHKSRFEHLLLSDGAAICDRCHQPATFAGIDEHRAARGENCLACHDPHAAERRYMLHPAEEAS